MKHKIWTLLFVILTLLFLPVYESGLVAAAPPPYANFKPGELLIKFESGVSAQNATQALDRYGATRIQALYRSDVELWEVPPGEERILAAKLSALPNVAYAEPNYIVRALETIPNDTLYNLQWAHTTMNSAQGWDVSTGTDTVTIAIIDSGVDGTHPDLAGKMTAGYDFIDDDSTPQDSNGHGTHVAGIAAAATNNGLDIAGTSWGARIMPIRVLDGNGSGTNAGVISGINWAVNEGAHVINLSLGGTAPSTSLQNAIQYALDNHVLVVASAGNCGASNYKENGCDYQDQPIYPARYDQSFAVAATDESDTSAAFSNRGDYVDIAAPGVAILSTYPDNKLAWGDGTSQAAPFVSGLAALVLSMNPTLTPSEVRSLIENHAVDLGPSGKDVDYGHGRIDVGTTLQAINVPQSPTLNAIINGDEDGDYVVTWTSDPEATSYTLEEDDNVDFASPRSINVGNDTQYTITQQAAGIWHYRVQASNASGSSTWSNVRSTSVLPTAPKLSNIDNASEEDVYTVSWSAIAGATHYTLQEAPTAAFSPTLLITRYVGSDVAYNVTGQRGGEWHYRVLAIASSGESDWSNVVSTTVKSSTLSPPLLNAIDNPDEEKAYLITWNSVTSATTYTLEESENPYFATVTEIYTGTATQFTVVDRSPGYWHYRVRAHSATDSSPWSQARMTYVGKLKVYLPLVMRQ